MTPETLCNSLERHNGVLNLPHWTTGDSPIDEEKWLQACENAIVRFDRDDFTSLDARRLAEAV